MISSLSTFLFYISNKYPIRFIFFLCSIFILFLSYKLYRYKVSLDYKIYRPIFNYIAISIYIFYYIILILVYRLYMFNQELDVNIIINIIKELHLKQGILFMLFIFSLWILFFICLITMRKIMIKEIIKYYISLYYHYGYFISRYYNIIYDHYYTYTWLHRKTSIYFWKLTKYIINISPYKYKKELIEKIGKSHNTFETTFILKILPLFILCSLFLYDCIFNHFIISKVFYFLPIYFIYNLWCQISQFLTSGNRLLNQVIYERYYQILNIAYLDTTDEEEESLKIYIKNGFKYNYTLLDLEELIPPIITYRRYVRIPGTNIFENNEIGKMTIIEDIQKLYEESPDA